MKNLNQILLAVGLLTTNCVYAQKDQVDTAIFGKIRRAELSNSHIPQIAHYLTDVSGPRLTNSLGYKRAATWAVETMQKWGLVNAKMEPWGEFGKQWDIQDISVYMKVPYAETVRAYPKPWSTNTNGTVQGEVLLLTPQQTMDTTYLASHAAEFKGKILLTTGGPTDAKEKFEPSASRLADTALANLKDAYMVDRSMIEKYKGYFKIFDVSDAIFKKSGALAYITTSPGSVNGSVVVQNSGSYYKTSAPETVPMLAMALEDGQKIKRLIGSGHKVELAININSQLSTQDTKGYNVVAEIPGTDPKLKSQLVMLGGHLDSWQSSTGATDNAAGCIVMMEAVRLLDSLGLKPKRTIRIALWGGEEQGLLGSINYAKNHFMDGKTFALKPEQAKVSAYFNLDNGTGKIRGIYAQNNEAIKPIFAEWLKPFADLGAQTVTSSNTGSTDHLSFDWAGIPGFQFVQDPIDYETRTHHTNLDDYDHLLIDDLKQAVVIVASFVYQASVRPDLLPRKPLKKETFVFDGF